jgi:hypothetical protein
VPLPRARRLTVLAVLAALLLGLLVVQAGSRPAAAGPGMAPGDAPQRTITYTVRTRGTVYGDVEEFRRLASVTLNDRRGWSLGGAIRYREVSSDPDFVLWLASPSAVAGFSPVCDEGYSCRVGSNVVINDLRWRKGTPVWPDVAEYHHYVVNHEVGHWLGMGHRTCTGSGDLAPVMQQQSIGLNGCVTNTWPTAVEKADVGRRYDVAVDTARPEVYAIDQDGTLGDADPRTLVHSLTATNLYRSFSGHARTPLGTTSPTGWFFAAVDRDRDGVDDVMAVKLWGDSGKVEVRSIDGASGFRSIDLSVATALPRTPAGEWTFDVADVDADGFQDVVMVDRHDAANRTKVHVLDGATKYATFLLHATTPLPNVTAADYTFLMGHHDRDGVPDLYAIKRRGGSGKTEVHVLDGVSGYRSWSGHAATPLPWTDDSYDFAVDDFDGDGWDEVWAVKRNGASGRTEVHVLADRGYDRFVASGSTVLPTTDGLPAWRFLVD